MKENIEIDPAIVRWILYGEKKPAFINNKIKPKIAPTVKGHKKKMLS